MSDLKNSASTMFAGDAGKTYARFPVRKDSARAAVKFAPLGANRTAARRAAARLFHHARRFERQTRTTARKQDGAIGRNGLAILHALIFDFIDHRTGRLDPSYEAIARSANISVRSVARGLMKLREAKILNWVRRVYEKVIGGAWRMAQDTNAYAIAPASQWKGFRPPADPPKPEPGTWGDHPPLPDALDQAAIDLRDGAMSTRSILAVLDDGDELTRALARLHPSRQP